MKIRQGWSGQVARDPDRWAKFDIELEEDDLRRMLLAGRVPEGIATKLITTTTAFQLMELEAEILIYVKLIARYGYPAAEGTTKITELKKQKQELLDKLSQPPTLPQQ